jgi:glutathione S-transferase
MIPRLVTIRFSHYCEKARWALDRARLAYDEDAHAPVLSYPAALRAAGKRTVPVLVTDDGVMSSSGAILDWADRRGTGPALRPPELAHAVAALERTFDDKLGPATRRVAYGHILPDRSSVATMFSSIGPAWERRVGTASHPAIAAFIRRGLKIDPAGVARSRRRVDAIFADVASRLDDGRRYLCGDAFTGADLTFAALAAPLVYPDGYARFGVPLEDMAPSVRELVRSYRHTRAGAFVLRLYAEDRDA